MIYEFQCNGDARHFDGILHAISLQALSSVQQLWGPLFYSLLFYRLSGGFVSNSRSIIYCSKVKKSQRCLCYSVRSLVKENNNFRWDFLRQTKQNDKNPDKSTKQKKKRHLGKHPLFRNFSILKFWLGLARFPPPPFFLFFLNPIIS